MNFSNEFPIVILYNYLETFREFLLKPGDESALFSRRYNGDQALYWLGSKKLLITPVPVANVDTLGSRWGYDEVVSISPQTLSAQISLEVMRDETVLSAIDAFAGEEKTIALFSYAATAELFFLAAFLEEERGIQVHLPETSPYENLWLKEYVDAKVGFRELVQRWLGDSYLPEGHIPNNLAMIPDIAKHFARSGRGVVIKENIGGSGVGNLFVTPQKILTQGISQEKLKHLAHSGDAIFVVEEWVPSEKNLSPSLEFFVPSPSQGMPFITYLCNQHFEDSGRFAGVIIAQELYQEPWYAELQEVGLKIAAKLQEFGYIGYFDLDCIVNDAGRLFLLEINTRRTGGTYVHEFLTQQFGADYSQHYAAFSQNKVQTRYHDLVSLEDAIGDLLFQPKKGCSGVVVLLTSQLSDGFFGYLILGEDIREILAIREAFLKRI